MSLLEYFNNMLNPHADDIKNANAYEDKCKIIIKVLNEYSYHPEPIGGDDKKFVDQCVDGVRVSSVANLITDMLSSHDTIKDIVMSAKNTAMDKDVSTEVNTILDYVKELLGVKG